MGFFSKKKPAQSESSSGEKRDVQTPAPAVSTPKDGDAIAYRVIVGPQVTEKASLGNAQGKYVFRVRGDSNKVLIKQSVEKLYGVKVRSVHVLYAPAKQRRIGRHLGEKSGYKKAIVTLKEGQKLDVLPTS